MVSEVGTAQGPFSVTLQSEFSKRAVRDNRPYLVTGLAGEAAGDEFLGEIDLAGGEVGGGGLGEAEN